MLNRGFIYLSLIYNINNNIVCYCTLNVFSYFEIRLYCDHLETKYFETNRPHFPLKT